MAAASDYWAGHPDPTRPMETAEEFMQQFFAARTAQLKSDLEARRPFRQKYFAQDCVWDSRSGSVERSAKEKVVSISNEGDDFYVVTNGTEPFPYLRYHLRGDGARWLIVEVLGACNLCGGRGGDKACRCAGTGWMLPAPKWGGGVDIHRKSIRRDPPNESRWLPPS